MTDQQEEFNSFESLNSLFESQEDGDVADADTGQGELEADEQLSGSGDEPTEDQPALGGSDGAEDAGDAEDQPSEVEGSDGSGSAEPESSEEGEGGTALEELVQAAQELGLNTDGIQSEAELVRRYNEQVTSMQGEVAAAREAPLPEQPPQPAGQLEQQAEAEGWSQEKYFSEKYGGPTWKQEYDNAMRQGLVVEGEAGYQLAENAPKTEETDRVVNEMNAALQHRQHFYADLANGNFYEKTFDVYREPIEKLIEERVQQALSARETENQALSYVDQFEKDNSSWMYAKDPSTGQLAETPKRQEFVRTVQEVQRMGVSDVENAIKIAMRGFDTGAQAAPVEEKTAQPVGTGESIENNQSIQTDQNTQQQSFLDRAREASSHSPSASGRDDDVPQVLSEGDLDGMFVRAFKESRGK